MHASSPASVWPLLLGLAALGVPLTYGLAAAFVSDGRPFRRAGAVAGACLFLAAAVGLIGGLVAPGAEVPLRGVQVDVLTTALLGLVSFIAAVILRFSRAYLRGDPGQARYVRWLFATLAAVTTLVVTSNLLVLALAWVGTSLALHQLLTFYADRPQALVAAHKKFLVSRVADLCLFGGIALLGLEVGSLDVGDVAAWAGAQGALPLRAQVAAVLLVLGASVKCAQLPFHGWLTQVMEAPTPVSALLHAGVVNIGGFLMIRLAPLMAKAELAQTLLVLIGSATAVIAALVMTTRVSVKVALAWSTCAQMGFMLVQCGLGAYHLALLHLLAHSLYKAHAFLSSGSAVEVWRAGALAPRRAPAGLARWIAAGLAAPVGVAIVAAAFGASPAEEPALWALATVLGLALAPLVVEGKGDVHGWARLLALGAGGVGVAALYFTWHALFGRALAPPPSGDLRLRLGVVVAAFAGLFLVQALLRARPHGGLARALYPRLYAGLYLDELFTRLTFRLWPPRLPESQEPRHAAHVVEAREA